MPITYTEFSRRIKNKYPEFINLDDKMLAEQFISANPKLYKNNVIFDEPAKKQNIVFDVKPISNLDRIKQSLKAGTSQAVDTLTKIKDIIRGKPEAVVSNLGSKGYAQYPNQNSAKNIIKSGTNETIGAIRSIKDIALGKNVSDFTSNIPEIQKAATAGVEKAIDYSKIPIGDAESLLKLETEAQEKRKKLAELIHSKSGGFVEKYPQTAVPVGIVSTIAETAVENIPTPAEAGAVLVGGAIGKNLTKSLPKSFLTEDLFKPKQTFLKKEIPHNIVTAKQTEIIKNLDPNRQKLISFLQGIKDGKTLREEVKAGLEQGLPDKIIKEKVNKLINSGEILDSAIKQGKLPIQQTTLPIKNAILPKDLQGAKPRYGYGSKQFQLQFNNDIDKAAYITAQKNKSVRNDDYLKFVMDNTGMTENEVISHGNLVKSTIKNQAKISDEGILNIDNIYKYKQIPIQPNNMQPSSTPPIIPPTQPVIPPILPEGMKERGHITTLKSLKNISDKVKEKLSSFYNLGSMGQWSNEADNVIKAKNGINITENIINGEWDLKDARQNMMLGLKLIKYYENAGDFDSSARIANHITAERGTQIAQALKSMNYIKDVNPITIVNAMEKKIIKAGKNIPKPQMDIIKQNAIAMSKLPEGFDKELTKFNIIQEMSSYNPMPVWDRIADLYKAGLLSGAKTFLINTGVSNPTSIGLRIIMDMPSAIVDRTLFKMGLSKTRKITPTLKGSWAGFKQGIKESKTLLKTGYDPRNELNKYEFSNQSFGRNKFWKVMQSMRDYTFRLQGVGDLPFSIMETARQTAQQKKLAQINLKNLPSRVEKETKNLWSETFARKVKEGKPEKIAKAQATIFVKKEKARLINKYTAEYTDENAMKEIAEKTSDEAIFRNPTALGKIGSFIQSLRPSMLKKYDIEIPKSLDVPVGKFVAPLAKTPASFTMAILDFSPIGYLKSAVNLAKGYSTGNTFQQRQGISQIGKASIGTLPFVYGWYKHAKDEMTLGYESNERLNNQLTLEGKQPNSIIHNGKTYQLNSLGLLGAQALLGGYARQFYVEEKGNIPKATLRLIAKFPEIASEQNFVKGLYSWTQAMIEGENRWENVAAQFASSFVPSMVADIAKSQDTIERQTYSPDLKERTINTIKNRIPFARKTLQPKINVFGESQTLHETFKIDNYDLGNMVNFLRPTDLKKQNDKTTQELRRLINLDTKDKQFIATPTQIKQKQKVEETDKETGNILKKEITIPAGARTYLLVKTGRDIKKTFDNYIENKGYKNKTDTEKKNILQNIASDINYVNNIKYLKKTGQLEKGDVMLKEFNIARVDITSGKLKAGITTMTPRQIYYFKGIYPVIPTFLSQETKKSIRNIE